MKGRLPIKALSVNKLYRGRRFKSNEYKDYSQRVLYLLPAGSIDSEEIELVITVGLSSPLADLSNVVKAFEDLLQEKYGFNDRFVREIHLYKEKVKKGEEYIEFEIIT